MKTVAAFLGLVLVGLSAVQVVAAYQIPGAKPSLGRQPLPKQVPPGAPSSQKSQAPDAKCEASRDPRSKFRNLGPAPAAIEGVKGKSVADFFKAQGYSNLGLGPKYMPPVDLYSWAIRGEATLRSDDGIIRAKIHSYSPETDLVLLRLICTPKGDSTDRCIQTIAKHAQVVGQSTKEKQKIESSVRDALTKISNDPNAELLRSGARMSTTSILLDDLHIHLASFVGKPPFKVIRADFSAAVTREWKAEDGKNSIDATYLSSDGKVVQLVTAEGDSVKKPLAELSVKDQEWVGKQNRFIMHGLPHALPLKKLP